MTISYAGENLEAAADQRLRPLYSPISIGSMQLRNRFVQSPIFTQFASPTGEVTDKLIEYHRRRARGGVGLIISENTSVDWTVGRSVGHPMRIDHDRYLSGLHDLAEAVHNEGAKMAVQLHHTGRQNTRKNTEIDSDPIAPSAGITSAFGSPPRAIRLDEIPELIEMYVSGARRAVAAGFDAVELHGAHGYLLQQFLSPKTNKRTDEYGGSFENRARFPLAVVDAVRAAVGADFPVLYRLSVEEPYEGGLAIEDGLAFSRLLDGRVDAIDVSAGNYDTAFAIQPMKVSGSLLHYAVSVKAVVNVPVIAIGRLAWRLEDCATAIEKGQVDLISMGRSGLADPELVRKTQRGAAANVRRCLAVNECVSRWMFAGQHTQCVINPALGREAEADVVQQQVADVKSVAIVGAGPSGCEAAIVAAKRGHRVTLFERESQIGGQLRAWAASPVMPDEIINLIGFYTAELERTGVSVRLGSDVESGDLADFDVVLLATGTEPAAGEAASTDAASMLRSGIAPTATDVDVVGTSEVAAHAALWLSAHGKTVTLSTLDGDVASDTNEMLRDRLRDELAKAGIDVRTGSQPRRDAQLTVTSDDRAASDFMSDQVDGGRISSIGVRFRGGRLYEATQSGFWAAARI